MSPASRSKSKDKKVGKEPPKASSKTSSHANVSAGVATSGYNPILGTFHALDPAPVTVAAAAPIHVNGRFKNIDETDDQNSNSFGTGVEYDSVSNNGSWSGESEDHKEKMAHLPLKQEIVPGADSDKREKIRQKNERKHQRQKERRAQELHEKCSGYLMSRKLEALAQQLVAMGFSQERATMALIQNEGRVEESVAWLFEGGEEADEHKEHDIDGGGNLKIDISEEINHISDMENRYKCSKQEVERVVVACEGDIEKAEETLKAQKLETTSVPSKTEETGDPPTVGSGKFPNTASQNSISAAVKHTSPAAILQQKRDEKDFNYTKVTATANSSIDPASKSIQSLKRVQPKMEWAKPPQVIVSSDKRWQGALSNPSAYSFTSSQASPSPAKTEAQYVAVENELKNLQLGSIREPVIVMQRPQSINAKQLPPSTMSSSPPGTAGGWYPNGVETMKSTGMVPHVPGLRNLSSPNTNQLYNQLHYQQQQQQYVSTNGGSHEPPGTSRGNGMWSRTGTSQPLTLAAASSLGLFSGLGTNGPSGSSSPVDWNSGYSMPQLDYNNIDWSLDRRSSSPISGGLWPTTMNSLMQNNHHTFNSFTNGLGARVAMKPTLSSGDGISIPRLQDGIAPVETSAGGSREWTSPFEEKDLFSLPRQFVSSPTL